MAGARLEVTLLDTLKTILHSITRELGVYRCALAHPAMPWLPRILLGAAIAYFVLPIDILPDFIPVIGQLDDLLIVPGLVWLALRFMPPTILTECRSKAA